MASGTIKPNVPYLRLPSHPYFAVSEVVNNGNTDYICFDFAANRDSYVGGTYQRIAFATDASDNAFAVQVWTGGSLTRDKWVKKDV